MNLKFPRALYSNFSIKVFIVITLLIFFVSFSFTALFVHQQAYSLKATLIKEGKVLVGMLAYNSRIGVFSENEAFLKDPVERIFTHDEVSEVSVFNQEGKLLKKQARSETRRQSPPFKGQIKNTNKIFEKFKGSTSPLCFEDKNKLEFWSPVVSGAGYSVAESLFFKTDLFQREKYIIGFVEITIDKDALNKNLKSLLAKGALLGIMFWTIGSGATYLMVKRMIRPLNRLTDGVKALELGGFAERVPVETEDEIGRLAEAFNKMSESLRRREVEKQRLEEQLRHAQKMEAIGTLSGGIAHDFNNILTVIMGFGSHLHMQLHKDNPLRPHVEQILTSAQKAAALTQSLLAFSRKHLIKRTPVNLNESIGSIGNVMLRLVREDIEIRIEPAKEDLFIMADPAQIDQILINLTTNARDAMPDGGVLTISTEAVVPNGDFFMANGYGGKSGPYALLSVKDTGCGMDEKSKERIFDPFFTTKGVGEGTGLGLSVIYGIVKQHKGHIDVRTKPGQGATFNVYFPLIEKPKSEGKASKTLSPLGYGTETVLLAEDDNSVRMFSRDILRQNGYRVIEAIDGEDAVRKFMENKEEIQIVLLDVIMPKKNGKAVYEEILQVRPDIKTLFMSGYTHNIIKEKGINEGEINFISKPFLPEALLSKMRQVLDE